MLYFPAGACDITLPPATFADYATLRRRYVATYATFYASRLRYADADFRRRRHALITRRSAAAPLILRCLRATLRALMMARCAQRRCHVDAQERASADIAMMPLTRLPLLLRCSMFYAACYAAITR